MIFHSFTNQDERRKFGGSAFIELQYCKQKIGTKLIKIIKSYRNWANDSLYIYVDDIELFCSNYEEIFYGGTYDNLDNGRIDFCGFNYYLPEQLKNIILKVEEQKPLDYEVILQWLKKGENFNGFYLLGI